MFESAPYDLTRCIPSACSNEAGKLGMLQVHSQACVVRESILVDSDKLRTYTTVSLLSIFVLRDTCYTTISASSSLALT